MTAQDLRNSILQLAMQGKLVEQRKEEGTAKELLAQIKAEKKRLLQEKKIKKEKPLPEITESEIPFEIPESWEWVRLSELCDMYTGNSISEYEKKNKYMNIEEGYDYIGTKDIHFTNVIEYDNGVKIPYTENFKNAPKNSILLCIEGGSAGKKIGFLDRKVCFGNKLCMINPIGMCNRLIYNQLQAPSFNTTFKGKITGIIGGISIGKLKTLLIAIPPLDEQKRIVAKMEEIFSYIEQYDKAYTKIDNFNKKFPTNMRKAILQLAIQGKLVEQREEEGTAEELYRKIILEKKQLIKEGKIRKEKSLPEIIEEREMKIPGKWKLCKLADISSKITDGEHKTPNRICNFEGYYLISARNVREGYISLTDVDYVDYEEYQRISKRCNPKKGDVVISCSGSIGRCAVITDNKNYVMVRSVAMVSSIWVDGTYLMYAIQSEYVQSQIRKGTKQTAQANLFQEAIRNLVIPLPPLAEQKRIVAKLEQLLPYCERLIK